MKRVLFVDDDPKILKGLQRMLRSMRHDWEMEFAEGAEAALADLEKRHFDVVVTDMRMPRMDGAALLSKVRELHPDTVRIVLSGHSDEELILSSVDTTHQYLSKPCDPELLKQTIGRACSLRDLLTSTSLTLLISQMQSLPSLPSISNELVKELETPEPSIKAIGLIISKDAGMTAKILQMVNSDFFGLRRRVSNPTDAVSLLGINIVKSLALPMHIFSQFGQIRIPKLAMERLWDHSLTVGLLAKQIAKAEKQTHQIVEDSFTAGLLHECGKLILATQLPEEYGAMLALAETENILEIEAEQKAFGATHSEVGAYLLGLWGLPDSIVEAVAFHQNPNQCFGEIFSPLSAVCAADFLIDETSAEGSKSAVRDEEVLTYLARLQLEQRLNSWRELRGIQND